MSVRLVNVSEFDSSLSLASSTKRPTTVAYLGQQHRVSPSSIQELKNACEHEPRGNSYTHHHNSPSKQFSPDMGERRPTWITAKPVHTSSQNHSETIPSHAHTFGGSVVGAHRAARRLGRERAVSGSRGRPARGAGAPLFCFGRRHGCRCCSGSSSSLLVFPSRRRGCCRLRGRGRGCARVPGLVFALLLLLELVGDTGHGRNRDRPPGRCGSATTDTRARKGLPLLFGALRGLGLLLC